MAQKTVLIKKYENRRLYDTTNSRYVNLEEVAQILQRGDEVRVVDAASGEDITRLILTQIIVEDAKTPNSHFPLDVLRQMVVASGQATQQNALKYMKAVLDMYQNAYRTMSPPLSPFEFIQNLQATRGPTVDTQPAPATETKRGNRPKAGRRPDDETVDELKQRVADLERLVSSLAPKAPKQKKK